MAEMDVPVKGGKHGGKQRSKKSSTRVDLTAMVDLGFLLITFFMLATTMNKPKTMQIIKPEDLEKPEDEPPYKLSKTVNLLLGGNDKVYWYVAADATENSDQLTLDSVDYSPGGVRKVIQKRQREVQAKWGNKDELFVMIKPLPGSKLKNTVDVLDEMTINDVKKYAILEPKDPIDSLVAIQIKQSRK